MTILLKTCDRYLEDKQVQHEIVWRQNNLTPIKMICYNSKGSFLSWRENIFVLHTFSYKAELKFILDLDYLGWYFNGILFKNRK